jgi:dTMP kinase
MKGKFITLEGLDGCGKSTQLKLLDQALLERGFKTVVTREPGGTPLGERMRAVLLSNESAALTAEAELLLMAADRAQDVAQVIRPALESGRIVISDRYADSTVAFQGYGRGLDLTLTAEVNRLATGGLKPDLTILFDIEPARARARLEARYADRASGNFEPGMGRIDDEHAAFHEQVYAGYCRMASEEPERIKIVDATGSPESTHRAVLDLVLKIIETK